MVSDSTEIKSDKIVEEDIQDLSGIQFFYGWYDVYGTG
jgi:hypothetical protein